MRALVAGLAIAFIALLSAATGSAQKPPKPPGQAAVTLQASANPVTFSRPLTLSGSVKGARAGVVVTLESRAPTATAYAPVGTATTDQKGDYTFSPRPRANTVYRVTAATAPPVQSAELLVRVSPLVGLRVSDTTPRAGQRVRFRGTVRPPHDGRLVAIQRKGADGKFVTVARTRLRDAGDEFSRYGRRVRVRSTGVYRTRVTGHDDHATGFSRERTLTVGG
jgi:hypothetical protein